MCKPALVLVSGAPGTGKTTMARCIAQALRVPYFGKDLLKESLFDTLGVKDREWSKKLGFASMALLFELIKAQLEAGRSVVAESNFYREFDVPRFQSLRDKYVFVLVEVHCETETSVLYSRLQKRHSSEERHTGHVDGPELHAEVDAALVRGAFEPLGVGDALIRVDTMRFGQMDYARVVSDVKSASGS